MVRVIERGSLTFLRLDTFVRSDDGFEGVYLDSLTSIWIL